MLEYFNIMTTSIEENLNTDYLADYLGGIIDVPRPNSTDYFIFTSLHIVATLANNGLT